MKPMSHYHWRCNHCIAFHFSAGVDAESGKSASESMREHIDMTGHSIEVTKTVDGEVVGHWLKGIETARDQGWIKNDVIVKVNGPFLIRC